MLRRATSMATVVARDQADNAVFSAKLKRITIQMYDNGVCCLSVWQNSYVQGNQRLSLLSYDLGLINDKDFLLLYPCFIFQNFDLPLNMDRVFVQRD